MPEMEQARAIFCATHPRACSTAFERVFMTRTDDLICAHEPFGDAFYYGPERLGTRYEKDEQARKDSGFEDSTYKTIFDRLDRDGEENKRIFIKDIIHYWFAPNQVAAQIAPSLHTIKRGVGTVNGNTNGTNGVKNGTSHSAPFPYGTHMEEGNPTVVPLDMMKRFHFTFLIRNPHNSIPSYYRCTVPPLDKVTGFYNFDPAEAGYDEVRRLFDFCIASGQIGPKVAGQTTEQINGHPINGKDSGVEICLVDADDLLDNPEGILKVYCKSVGLDYSPNMLKWDTDAAHEEAKVAFEKWPGWHDDALHSKDLKPRAHKKKQKTEEEWDAEWKSKFGDEGAKIIRESVDKNMADYLYLKQYAIKV